jgi:hypothetical protein
LAASRDSKRQLGLSWQLGTGNLGTLSSELSPLVERTAGQPRIYADANIPTGAVAYMREKLGWDVFFVLEDDVMRRARDIEHFRLARQLGRTLVTLDRDYLDDREFPPGEGAGVIVFSAPDERWLQRLLRRVHQEAFQTGVALPFAGRKLQCHMGQAEGDVAHACE